MSAEQQALRCEDGHSWTRTRRPGRPPARCPEHEASPDRGTVTQTPVAYKGTDMAAAAVGVSERTIRRAMHNTDPSQYPPPLTPDGRHGERGPFAFLDSTLRAWVEALARFDT